MSHGTFPEYLDNVWVYLRKSREDREAEERARREGREEIETLTRHRRALFALAHKHHWNITQVCEEVVSGEYISDRPEVQRVLSAIERGEADAVLVMDIDRLGRGDMEDQGRILRVFREAVANILTPDKVYDLSNEMDEEWTEFKAFFARRELKMITKRMQRGRQASVAEGKYIATRPPFGYDVNSDHVLVPNKDADTIRLIFDLHANHGMGGGHIANHLNSIGITTPWGKTWRAPSVIAILRNEHYAGYIIWRKIKVDKRKGTAKKRPDAEVIRARGKHEPLVSKELFEKSARIRASRSNYPVGLAKGITNPLAGLIICSKCGEPMVKRPSTKQAPHLMCKNPNCKQRSTRLEFVEARLLRAMREWLHDYRKAVEEAAATLQSAPRVTVDYKRVLDGIDEEIRRVNMQRDELHDLLERKVYDADTYLERNQKLLARLTELRNRRESVEEQSSQSERIEEARGDIIPAVTHVLDAYHQTTSAKEQNTLLKSVLEKAVYDKEQSQRGDQFELSLYPAIWSK